MRMILSIVVAMETLTAHDPVSLRLVDEGWEVVSRDGTVLGLVTPGKPWESRVGQIVGADVGNTDGNYASALDYLAMLFPVAKATLHPGDVDVISHLLRTGTGNGATWAAAVDAAGNDQARLNMLRTIGIEDSVLSEKLGTSTTEQLSRPSVGVGTRYRKKPVVVEAVRYGKDEDGRWYDGAATRVAQFMLGVSPDTALTDHQIVDVLRPVGAWSPPGHAELEMWDGVAHGKWLPLAPGDWVIRGVNCEFYPCKPDIFEATYEPVDPDPMAAA